MEKKAALKGCSTTLTPQKATDATYFGPFSWGIHRYFIALCYLRFTGVRLFLSRCLVEEQASGPLPFRINPRCSELGRSVQVSSSPGGSYPWSGAPRSSADRQARDRRAQKA
jgi:hypothetical protein